MVNLSVPYARPNYALKTLVGELYEHWGLPSRAPEYVTGYKSASNLTGHNADSNGIVHAVDLFFGGSSQWTEARGWELAELLRKEGPKGWIDGHPDRMYYIIYRDHIAGDFSNWEWTGSGYGHWDHVHVSTCDMYWGDPAPISALDYDSKAPWNLWAVTNTSGEITQEDTLSAAEVKEIKDHINAVMLGGYTWANKKFPGVVAELRSGIADVPTKVWGAQISRADGKVSVIQELANNTTDTMKLKAMVEAQGAAIKALASGSGLDPAQLDAAIQAAVKKAIDGTSFVMETK